jgi:hypothetical protein
LIFLVGRGSKTRFRGLVIALKRLLLAPKKSFILIRNAKTSTNSPT